MTVDITAYLNDEDETGLVWTFLDEARDPSVIVPGAIVLAGDDDEQAIAQVVDLADRQPRNNVHIRPVPGRVEDYAAFVRRVLPPSNAR